MKNSNKLRKQLGMVKKFKIPYQENMKIKKKNWTKSIK